MTSDRYQQQGVPAADERQTASIGCVIEHAAVGDDGKRRVRGVANTFKIMRSGRMIHPAAVTQWLERNPDASVPLMAQHGYVPGFATIGRVTKLGASQSRGLTFEAEIAEGIGLAEEAWKLVSQKMLSGVSIGWIGNAQWVHIKDADIDDWTKRQLKETEREAAQVFKSFELLEVSLVDVADDRGGKLAAQLQQQIAAQLGAQFAELLNSLRGELAELHKQSAEGLFKELSTTLGTGIEQAITAAHEEAVERLMALHEEFRGAFGGEGCGSSADADPSTPHEHAGSAAPAGDASALDGLIGQLTEQLKGIKGLRD